jgi:hypothetical protein
MDLINCTPHRLNIQRLDLTWMVLEPSGILPRVELDREPVDPICGVSITVTAPREVVGLPEVRDGIYYVVSGMVEAASGRADLLSPGPLVRDEQGRPRGCRGLKTSR